MNIINHLEFTIKSARKLPFFSSDYELSEWVRDAALPVVDEVFSQMDFSNDQVVIENLVLDMGEFSENNFCSDFPEKLSISLKTALEAHLATSCTTNNTLSGNQLDAFFQEAYGLAEIDIIKQWHQLNPVSQSASHKVLLIKLRDSKVRQIIAKRFPEKIQQEIFQLLEPANFNIIVDVLSNSYLFENNNLHIVNSEKIPIDNRLKSYLVEMTLSYLVLKANNQFSCKEYLHYLLQHIAQQQNRDYDDLLKSLNQRIKTTTLANKLKKNITYLANLRQTLDEQGVLTSTKIDNNKGSHSLLTELLCCVLNNGKWFLLQAYWLELTSGYVAEVKKTLLKEGRSLHVRQNISTFFPETAFKDIVEIVVPRHFSYINKIISQSSLLRQDEYLSENLILQSEGKTFNDKLNMLFKQSTLNYLFTEGGTDFNKKTYLRSLLRQIAESASIHYDDLLAKLYHSFKTNSSDSELTQGLLEILGGNFTTPAQKVTFDSNAENKLSAGYRLYNRLYTLMRDAIKNKSRVEHSEWGQLLNQLDNNYPVQLQRFFRELQLDALNRENLYAVLEADSLRLCSVIYIRICRHINDKDNYLLGSIDSYSAKATDKKSCYKYLLSALLDRQLIDLEKITQLSASVGQHEEKNIKQRAYKTYQQRQIDELTIQLKSFAKTDEFTDERYQRFLRDLLQDQQQIKLLSYLPEDSLCQLCYTGSPAVFSEAITLGEQLRLALLNKQLDLPVKEISQIHWQSLLLYTSEAKDSFSADRFVQIYLRQLNNRVDYQLDFFKPIIAQQLVLNQTDSDQAHLRSLIKVIDSLSEHDLKGDKENLNHEIDEPEIQAHQADDFSVKSGDMIPVHNCGLVLATSYIPLLFNRLKLTDSGQFVSAQHAHKAVHLLRYLVYGELTIETCDFQLEKLICGLALNSKINVDYEIKETEKELIDSLLTDLIHSWSAIGKTSIEGLRETFLQRDGSLIKLDEKSWKLVVQPSPFDMLLDRMPWSYSNIKHSFMQDLIYVDWRSGADR